MEAKPHTHPLACLVARHGGKYVVYLRKVADAYRALGYGTLACRPEKVCRWIAGTTPTYETQLAMAAVEGIRARATDPK